MINKYGLRTFVGKTLQGIDGQARDSSSKDLPTDLKADLSPDTVMCGVIVKDIVFSSQISKNRSELLILSVITLKSHPLSLTRMHPFWKDLRKRSAEMLTKVISS